MGLSLTLVNLNPNNQSSFIISFGWQPQAQLGDGNFLFPCSPAQIL